MKKRYRSHYKPKMPLCERYNDTSTFYLPRFNTVTYGKYSIRYLGLRLWRKLTNRERSAINVEQFKTHIRRLDLGNVLDGCSGCHLCNS